MPGQSGNQGRRRKKVEAHTQLVARVLNETVEVGGKRMSKIELAVHQTVNQTIKSGKPRDLKLLIDLMKDVGAFSEVDRQAEMEQAANEAMAKISLIVDRTFNIDPEDAAALDQDSDAEVDLVLSCSCCGAQLRARWKDRSYAARAKRIGETAIHRAAMSAQNRKKGRPF